MDANGLSFWMISQPPDWLSPQLQAEVWAGAATVNGLLSPQGLYVSPKTNRLHLSSVFGSTLPTEDLTLAAGLVELSPTTGDAFDTYARWDHTSGHVVAGGGGPGEIPIYAAPPGQVVTDLVLGNDDILYAAVGGALALIDRRGRWPNYTLAVGNFAFWRLAPLAGGGVLALDRSAGQLGKVTGAPLQTGPLDVPAPGILRSCDPNANPPRIAGRFPLAVPNESLVALAAMGAGQFALLTWSQQNLTAFVRTFSETAGLSAPLQLEDVQRPYTLAWIGGQQLAVLVTAKAGTTFNEALIFDLGSAGTVSVPSGDSYILTGTNLGPFAHVPALPARYPNPTWFDGTIPAWSPTTVYPLGNSVLDPNANIQTVQTAGSSAAVPPAWKTAAGQLTGDGTVVWTNAGALSPLLPLLPLSLNSFAAGGATDPANPSVCDSGTSQTVWHRLFIEAIVPPACGVLIWLTASDTLSDLTLNTTTWYPHILGTPDVSGISPVVLPDVPSAVWQSEACEVAFGPALLSQQPVQGRQGLFMVLVQRAGKAVRSLTGRYLGVRVALSGNGRSTPEIAGLRTYASRFSYVDHYLPALYREDKFGAAADQSGPSTRRDFLERFVDLFEAQFTRIEDRVANAYLLTRPESTPAAALDWLGGWVGVDPTDGYPPDRKRARLEALPSLYAQRGTAQGIKQALDVATNGLCTQGAIIVIEDFRLRHIFATIVGANLSDQNDPLLPGFSGSSNSFVGDALFLGDPRIAGELQALYATNLDLPGSQVQTQQQFYDQFANRMTIFVHTQVESVDFSLVSRIVEAEKPAHVLASVVRASRPLMIGLASLLGVNTYLGPEPAAGTATVDVSSVGRYDVVTHMPSLDPRLAGDLEGAQWQLPVARIVAPKSVASGAVIVLDGSGSTASPGATIVGYQWSLVSA